LFENLRLDDKNERNCTYSNHLAFSWHVGGAVGEAQFGLQGVEVGLELGLLLDTGWLVLAAVGAVLLQFLLHADQAVVGLAALQPGHGAADPLQQLFTKI
jgi:hypothetical protein